MPYISWDDMETSENRAGKSRSGGGSGKFLKLEANCSYQVRPVHKQYAFFKLNYTHPKGFRSANVDDPEASTAVANPDVRVARRFAIIVIDRSDGNLKILEGPVSIFEGFKKFFDITKVEPGGKDGGDFKIEVVSPSGKKDRNTSYKVDFVGRTPFTAEERDLIVEKKDEFNLPEIFKAHTEDEIQERLFSDEGPVKRDANQSASGSSGYANGGAQTQQPKRNPEPAAQAQNAPDAGGDPFDW